MPGATATAVVGNDGTLARVVVSLGGVFEDPAPTLLFSGGGGTGAAASAALDYSLNHVHRLHVVVSGQNYTVPPLVTFHYLSDNTVPPYLAATTTLLSTGSVVSVTLTAPGTGFTAPPVIAFPAGTGTGAAATAVLSPTGKVIGVTVINPGAYRVTPDVVFIGDGTGAAANATLATTGPVVALNLTSLGAYTVAPSVVFSGGHSGLALATAIYHIGDTEWPTLPGFHTDEVTGIVVNSFYKVVPKGTPYPGRSGYRGPFVEMNKYDTWKSIQIVSAIDLNTLPTPESWRTTRPFDLPPRLLSVEALWSDVVGKSADATGDVDGFTQAGVSVSVSSGLSGDIIVTSSSGFRGHADAILTREYFYGPIPLGSFLSPRKIIGSSGSIILVSTNSSTFTSGSDDLTGSVINTANFTLSNAGGKIGDQFQKQIHSVDVRDHLVGNFQIIGAEKFSQPVSASGTSGGGRTRTIASFFGTRSYMEVRIPQSSPSPESLVPGGWIVVDQQPTEWRFGVWVLETIHVIIPVF